MFWLEKVFIKLSNLLVFFNVPLGIWTAFIAAIFMTYRIRFVNILLFYKAFGMFGSTEDTTDTQNIDNDTGERRTQDKRVSPLKAFCVQTASTLGIGAIAGSVFALKAGGPGTVIWILIFAMLFSAIKCGEVILGNIYKNTDANNVVDGGMYYIFKKSTAGTKFAKIGILFAINASLATLVVVSFWSGLQLNQIVAVIFDGFALVNSKADTGSILPILTIVFLVSSVLFILQGGIHRTSSIMAAIVPFMVITYILIISIVLVARHSYFDSAIAQIMEGAFNFRAIASGGFVVLIVSMQRLFLSTEVGIGTCAVAGSASNTKYVARQGFLAFVDTMCAALVMSTGVLALILMEVNTKFSGSVTGVYVVRAALNQIHPSIGYAFVAVVFAFGFTTLAGNGYVVQRAQKSIFKNLSVFQANCVYILLVLCCSIFTGPVLIQMIDTITYFLLVPNLCITMILSSKIREQIDLFLDYLKHEEKKKKSA